MRIGIPRESRDSETRVSATPETVKKYVAAGHQVLVERDAGLTAHFGNDAYEQAGASISDASQVFAAELILKVRAPSTAELTQIKAGTALAGMLDPFDAEGLNAMACLLYTSPSPRDGLLSRMPSSA